MHRVVNRELLDELSPADPRAVSSRIDLRRLNFIMGHESTLARAFHLYLSRQFQPSRPVRVVDLGAGDGRLLLRIAARCLPLNLTVQATLVDRQTIVSLETRRAFAALNWSVECVETDALTWLEQSYPTSDLMFANLFLHHFPDKPLRALLGLAAGRTNEFIACEPRRSPIALTASRMLWLMGCNSVTRHDAIASVCAGFVGRELTELWPSQTGWELSEHPFGFFSHSFVAKRHV